MTIFQGYDGELRLIDYGNSGTTYHLEILFCEMDFTGPTSRPMPEETLILDRGRWDSQVRMREESDMVRFAPIPFSFSCRLADTVNTQIVSDWISGVTNISGSTQLYSFKGKTTIDGVTCPDFVGNTNKYAYRFEILWDIANSYGIRYDEVFFKPGQQQIVEAPDSLILNCSGFIYGGVSRISSFMGSTVTIV